MANVFFSYSHKDIDIRDEIDRHFSVMKRSGLIQTWYDREIEAGNEFDVEIRQELEDADIILLLVSSDFLNSSYCQDVEVKRALEKHKIGEAKVVPIIVDVCDWKHTVLKKLKSLPNDGRPIKKYGNRKEAYQDITNEIRRVANRIHHPYRTFVKETVRLAASSSIKKNKKSGSQGGLISFLIRNPKIILFGGLLIFFFLLSNSNKSNQAGGLPSNNREFNDIPVIQEQPALDYGNESSKTAEIDLRESKLDENLANITEQVADSTINSNVSNENKKDLVENSRGNDLSDEKEISKSPKESLKFKDYPVESIYKGKPAKLKMDDEFAKMFRTRLTEALSEEPSFAGEYVSATWGCGTYCSMTSFINKRTGKVLDRGFGGEFGPFIVDYRINSRLLVAQGPILDKNGVETEKYAAFFYLLDKGKLDLVKTIEIDKPDDINDDGIKE